MSRPFFSTTYVGLTLKTHFKKYVGATHFFVRGFFDFFRGQKVSCGDGFFEMSFELGQHKEWKRKAWMWAFQQKNVQGIRLPNFIT